MNLKSRLTRSNMRFALTHPRLTLQLLSGRSSYEEMLRSLMSNELEHLRNYTSRVHLSKSFRQLSQNEIDEILDLITDANRNLSWRLLDRWHSFLYAITRAVLPTNVVETGVLYGHSSAAILAALEDTGNGKLISIDIPVEQHQTIVVGQQYVQVGLTSNKVSVGCAVPFPLRSRWSLRLGNSLELLPKIFDELGPVSMFIHDSLHTYDHMMAEFRLGYDAMEPGGILVSDDIDYNSAWFDFCHSKKENWTALSKEANASERFAFLIKSNRTGLDDLQHSG